MKRSGTRVATGMGLVLALLAAIAASASSTPPYKIAVSGPGIDGERTVWLASDKETIQALHSGLLSETPVDDQTNRQTTKGTK